MKAKLLKKVRRRFSILHQTKTSSVDGQIIDINMFKLIDSEDPEGYYNEKAKVVPNLSTDRNGKYHEYSSTWTFKTNEECVNFLKNYIIVRLRSEGYRQRRDRVVTKSIKKIWYI